MPRHRVQIESDGPLAHRLLVDGQDLSKAVRSLTLRIDAGDLPELSLDLIAFDVGRYDSEDVRVVITDPSHDALVALGWTPPPGETEAV